VTALGELRSLLRGGGRKAGKVAELRLEVSGGLRLIGGLHPLAQLLLGQPARAEVLAELLHRAIALLVRDPKVRRHTSNLTPRRYAP
jgi:hypothetical protein